MSLLDRAKSFLSAKAAKVALTAIPLAALTVVTPPAKAGAVAGVSMDTGSCSVTTGFSGSCTVVQAAAAGGNSSANWLSLFTTINGLPDGSGSLSYSASGTASGFLGANGSLPVSWDFFVDGEGADVSWDILFGLNVSGSFASYSTSGVVAPGNGVQGNASIDVFPGAPINGWLMELNFHQTAIEPSYEVWIPGATSLDLNSPTAQAAVPEPGSALLLMGAGGALLLLRKKQKQS